MRRAPTTKPTAQWTKTRGQRILAAAPAEGRPLLRLPLELFQQILQILLIRRLPTLRERREPWNRRHPRQPARQHPSQALEGEDDDQRVRRDASQTAQAPGQLRRDRIGPRREPLAKERRGDAAE